MGNSLHHCPTNETTVRVYRGDDGYLVQFRKPIPVATLMRKHPNHLLIYSVVQVRETLSAHQSRVFQRSVQIRLVRPGDYLRGGRDYFLVYIPAQYRPRFAKYFDGSLTETNLAARPASPLSGPYRNPSASPLYSPTASPLYSSTASPLYSSTASPLYSSTASPLSGRTASTLGSRAISPHPSFWSSTASPLAAPLKNSRLDHRTRVAGPRSASVAPSSGNNTQTTRVATPRSIHIPVRSFNGNSRETTRVSSPLSNHMPTRSKGNSQSTTRVATIQPFRSPLRGNSRDITRVSSPLSNHIPVRSNGNSQATKMAVSDMHVQRNQAHSSRIQSLGGSGTAGQRVTLGSIISGSYNQNPLPSGLASSAGRVTPPAAAREDTISSILHQNHSQAQQNSTNILTRTPGNSGDTQSKGTFNQRQKGSSPYSSRINPCKSSKLGSGKFNLRQRRSGMRFQSRNFISRGVSPSMPRSKKGVSLFRFDWSPGLGSISENSSWDTSGMDESDVRLKTPEPERQASFRRAI